MRAGSQKGGEGPQWEAGKIYSRRCTKSTDRARRKRHLPRRKSRGWRCVKERRFNGGFASQE